MKRTIVFLLLIISFVFTACEKNVTVEVPYAESKIVVEGYIEIDQYPVVVLSHTLPFFGTINIENVTQNTIQNAIVTVYNGSETDTLVQVPGYGIYFGTG